MGNPLDIAPAESLAPARLHPPEEPERASALAEALEGERRRSRAVAAAVRLGATLVFLPVVSALSVFAGADWKPYVLPLAVYTALAAVVFALRQRPSSSWVWPLDVLAIYVLQTLALPVSPFPAGVAGFSLGLFALLVVLTGITLRTSVTYLTAAAAVVGQLSLMSQAGVSAGPMVIAVLVLFLVAYISQTQTPRLMGLAVGLAKSEVTRQLAHHQLQQSESRRALIELWWKQSRAHNEQLAKLQKDKDALVNLLVHDFRVPLTVLYGHLDAIDAQLHHPQDERTRESRREAELAIERLVEMTADLLDVSKLEEGRLVLNLEPVAAREMLEACQRQFAPLAEERMLQLEVDVPEGLAVTADPKVLRRVVENLLSNALRFTPSGRRVRLDAGAVPGGVTLAVRNEGEPIPQEHRAALFEKFHQVHASGTARMSWGLGLYFCKLAAEAHGGQVFIENVPGWPTSFVVRLPCDARAQ